MSKSIKLGEDTIFVGCTHLDHDRDFIWGPRGFKNVKENNEFIVHGIQDYAKAFPNASIVHLGDGFLNSTADRAAEYFRRFQLHVYYIWGNHEGPSRQLYNKELDAYNYVGCEVYPWTMENLNVTFLGSQANFSIGGQSIFAHHFPFAIWDKSHHGRWHVHSHNHHSFPESHADNLAVKRLDCGVDSCIKYFNQPYITFRQLKEIMDKKNVHKVDHHSKETT